VPNPKPKTKLKFNLSLTPSCPFPIHILRSTTVRIRGNIFCKLSWNPKSGMPRIGCLLPSVLVYSIYVITFSNAYFERVPEMFSISTFHVLPIPPPPCTWHNVCSVVTFFPFKPQLHITSTFHSYLMFAGKKVSTNYLSTISTCASSKYEYEYEYYGYSFCLCALFRLGSAFFFALCQQFRFRHVGKSCRHKHFGSSCGLDVPLS